MEKCFSGKRAVVIGGTGGIGRGISLALAAEGASVLAVGKHSRPDASSLEGVSGIQIMNVDLDIPGNQDIIKNSIIDADILCLVRGPFVQKPLHETTTADWEFMARANLAFPGSLVSAVLPHMMASGWGRIVLFGGTRTDRIREFRTNAAYAAAKTGLSVLARSVAAEYGEHGITCNVICPGFVDTEYLEPEQKRQLAEKNPDGKLLSVTELAEFTLFLLKNTAANGIILPVDKGWTPKFI